MACAQNSRITWRHKPQGESGDATSLSACFSGYGQVDAIEGHT